MANQSNLKLPPQAVPAGHCSCKTQIPADNAFGQAEVEDSESQTSEDQMEALTETQWVETPKDHFGLKLDSSSNIFMLVSSFYMLFPVMTQATLMLVR